jgi:hypothetical protein
MNLASCTAQPLSNPKSDLLVDRLQNVFRVLSKPEHEMRGEAMKLRANLLNMGYSGNPKRVVPVANYYRISGSATFERHRLAATWHADIWDTM